MSRISLTAPATVYFDPNGSDTLGNGSQADPWQTPQGTWDNLKQGYDLCGFPLTMQATAGEVGNQINYTGLNISGRLPGQGGSIPPAIVGSGSPPQTWGDYAPVTLRGDPSNPGGTFLYPPYNASDLQAGCSMTEGAGLVISGFGIDTGISLNDCLQVFDGATVVLENVLFGAAGQAPAQNPQCNHISCALKGSVYITGQLSFAGNAQCGIDCAQFGMVFANTNGVVPIRISIIKPITFGVAFMYADTGRIDAYGLTYDNGIVGQPPNTITGYGPWLENFGVINTAGQKNVPGSKGVNNISGLYV